MLNNTSALSEIPRRFDLLLAGLLWLVARQGPMLAEYHRYMACRQDKNQGARRNAYERLEFLASRTDHQRNCRRRLEEIPTDDKEEEDGSFSFTMTITQVSPCAVGLVCLSGEAVEVNEESVHGVGFEFYSNDLRLMTARDLGIFARKELGLNGYTPPGVKTRIVKEGRVLDKYEVLDECVLQRLLKRFEADEDKHRRIEDMYRRMYKGA